MAVTLKKATRGDIETIWKMQVEAFADLLDKYQDFDISPATESLEKIIAKFYLLAGIIVMTIDLLLYVTTKSNGLFPISIYNYLIAALSFFGVYLVYTKGKIEK